MPRTAARAARATHLVELRQGLPDDLDSLPEVFLADDQRRGETDAVARISNVTQHTPKS